MCLEGGGIAPPSGSFPDYNYHNCDDDAIIFVIMKCRTAADS